MKTSFHPSVEIKQTRNILVPKRILDDHRAVTMFKNKVVAIRCPQGSILVRRTIVDNLMQTIWAKLWPSSSQSDTTVGGDMTR
jgi:hypothetical protein